VEPLSAYIRKRTQQLSRKTKFSAHLPLHPIPPTETQAKAHDSPSHRTCALAAVPRIRVEAIKVADDHRLPGRVEGRAREFTHVAIFRIVEGLAERAARVRVEEEHTACERRRGEGEGGREDADA
jgi:hypothetical protein